MGYVRKNKKRNNINVLLGSGYFELIFSVYKNKETGQLTNRRSSCLVIKPKYHLAGNHTYDVSGIRFRLQITTRSMLDYCKNYKPNL